MLPSKVCIRCGESKPEEEFVRKGDARRGECKGCHRLLCQRYREANRGKIRAYERARMAGMRKSNPELPRSRWREWAAKNPDLIASRYRKYYSVTVLNNAVKLGHAKRPDACSSCGVQCKPEGHHPDYSKPLDVVWLCKSCHGVTWRKGQDEHAK